MEQLGHKPFAFLGILVDQDLSDDQAKDAIAEKLHALVRKAGATAILVNQAWMNERVDQQVFIIEFIAQQRLQLVVFVAVKRRRSREACAMSPCLSTSLGQLGSKLSIASKVGR